MNNSKKIYFVSDVHLGESKEQSERDKQDKLFVSWLNLVSKDAEKIFLLGDIFDFWFEHRNNIPNYYGRVLSKLQELIENGIEIHFFVGNHDTWTFGYLEKQIGLIVHYEPEEITLYGKKIVMGHGHNLKVDEPIPLKIMNSLFNSKWLYKTITIVVNPDLMMWFGRSWSRSRTDEKKEVPQFKGEKEFVTIYCNRYLKKQSDVKYFIFGHLHTPIAYPLLESDSTLFILSSWVEDTIVYGVLSPDGTLELRDVKHTRDAFRTK